jgi:hypothetical protein
LALINAATTVAVNAAAVTTVTATEVAAYAAADGAGTITAATNYAATLSDTTPDALSAEAFLQEMVWAQLIFRLLLQLTLLLPNITLFLRTFYGGFVSSYCDIFQ